MPLAAVLCLVGVGQPLQSVTVDDSNRGPLNDDIEAASPGVVASRERHLTAVFEIASLLLPKPGAEMHDFVLQHADQRGHMRATVGPYRREPVQLRLLEHTLGVRPRSRGCLGIAEPAIDLSNWIGLHGSRTSCIRIDTSKDQEAGEHPSGPRSMLPLRP